MELDGSWRRAGGERCRRVVVGRVARAGPSGVAVLLHESFINMKVAVDGPNINMQFLASPPKVSPHSRWWMVGFQLL